MLFEKLLAKKFRAMRSKRTLLVVFFVLLAFVTAEEGTFAKQEGLCKLK
jgi:hypothetical protein